MSSAVVFAYHNVGVRCLSVLLAHGVEVPLVVTHKDNSKETIWFDSVAELAELHGIPTITPDNPNTPEVVAADPRLASGFFLFVLLPRDAQARVAGDTMARRAEHARFAAAEIPRARAGELGDNPRRNGNRRNAALHDREAGQRRHRRAAGRADLAERHGAAGVPEGHRGGGDGAERSAAGPAGRARASGGTGSGQGRLFRRTQGGRRHHRLVAVRAGDPQPGARGGAALSGRDDTS